MRFIMPMISGRTTRGAEGVRGRLARDRTGMTILRGAGRRCGIRHLRALGGVGTGLIGLREGL